MKRILLAAMLASGLGLLAVACGGGSIVRPVPTPGPGGETVIRVEMSENRFTPANLTVRAGKKYILQLVNRGKQAHNLRIAGPDGEYNTEDDIVSERIPAGKTGTLAFQIDTVGAYDIRCDEHAVDQTGTLNVWEAPPIVVVESPTPPPPGEEAGEGVEAPTEVPLETPLEEPVEAPAETPGEAPSGP